jgi:hypothetical protein
MVESVQIGFENSLMSRVIFSRTQKANQIQSMLSERAAKFEPQKQKEPEDREGTSTCTAIVLIFGEIIDLTSNGYCRLAMFLSSVDHWTGQPFLFYHSFRDQHVIKKHP